MEEPLEHDKGMEGTEMEVEETEPSSTYIPSNSDITTRRLNKDQLPGALCCRLCASGSEISEFGEEGDKSADFVDLFVKENAQSEEEPTQSLPLFRTINKYLPIVVTEADPFYPKFVCSTCVQLLEMMVQFIDKIAEGQRVLAKILNEKSLKKTKKRKRETQELVFSDENPLVKAPKRRGRPRKMEDECKSPRNGDVSAAEGLPEVPPPEYTERRTRRQTRPPVRYVDEFISGVNEEEKATDDIKIDSKLFHINVLPNMTCKSADDTSAFIDTLQPDFNIATQHVDIEKLDVFNDGDVADTVSKLVHDLDSTDAMGLAASNGATLFEQPNYLPQVMIMESALLDPEDDDLTDKTLSLKNIRSTKPTRRKKKGKRVATKKSTAKIQCDQCPKVFNYTSSLVYHRLSVHDKAKKFVCQICGRGFASKNVFKNHKYVHTDAKDFNCDVCDAKFKSRASLYTHKKSRHSSTREFTCEICGYQFSLKASLIGHMRLHTGEKPFHCDFCEKKFAQRSSLREHRRTHTGEKPYTCDLCSKSFTTSSQLRSHRFSHTDEKLHLCQICGKGFNHGENFKTHMRRHNSEKPVKCPLCDMEFAERWTFKKHFRMHTGEKPYQCHCGRFFADPSNFAKHKKTHKTATETSTIDGEEYLDQDFTDENGMEELIETIIDDTDTPHTETFITGGTSPSVVQIVDSEEYPVVQEISQEDGVEQVIYVYSGENLYTLAVGGDTQEEVIVQEEDIQHMSVETVEDPVPLDNFNPNDIDSHYYSLETVGDNTTVAVPIQIPISRPGSASAGLSFSK